MTTLLNKDVDQYISTFPKEVAIVLQQIRETILLNAPNAEEGISYAMPAYKLFGKPLVYFAGFKNHIGFYATPSGQEEFKEDLSPYKQGKGSVQFPISEKMPLDLIARMVRFRAEENAAKAKHKK